MFKFFERITNAIENNGWNFIELPDRNYFPLRLKIYNYKECYNTRFYFSYIQDDGTLERPIEEYYVNYEKVDKFEKELDGKTIILGWWEEGEIFVGFDYDMFAGQLESLLSTQIKGEALSKAYIKVLAALVCGDQKIAIMFKPEFFIEYIKNNKALHAFGESISDLNILEELIENPFKINNSKAFSLSPEKALAATELIKKIRKMRFNSRVITSYSNTCAFCGVRLKFPDVVHIVPVQHGGTNETCNGISLCKLHSRCYTKNLIAFNQEYQIIVNAREMIKLSDMGLDKGMDIFEDLCSVIVLPITISDRPHTEYINLANRLRGWN